MVSEHVLKVKSENILLTNKIFLDNWIFWITFASEILKITNQEKN